MRRSNNIAYHVLVSRKDNTNFMFYSLGANGAAARKQICWGHCVQLQLNNGCSHSGCSVLIFDGNRIALYMRSHSFHFYSVRWRCLLSIILLLAFIPLVFADLINIYTACDGWCRVRVCVVRSFIFHFCCRYPAARKWNKNTALRMGLRQDPIRWAYLNRDLEYKCKPFHPSEWGPEYQCFFDWRICWLCSVYAGVLPLTSVLSQRWIPNKQ